MSRSPQQHVLRAAVGVLACILGRCYAQSACQNYCSSGACYVDGVRNEALGNAHLSITNECSLLVDNIGGSGLDGVTQTSLSSCYMAMTLAGPNFSLSAAGTQAAVRQLGVVSGTADQEIMLTQFVNYNNQNIRQSVDCNYLRPAHYVLSVFNSDHLVAEQDLGSNAPVLTYPKGDLLWMACGVLTNGDLYSVLEVGGLVPIRVENPGAQPGPFIGNLVFVKALSPQLIPMLQQNINETFFATGPVKVTAMTVSSDSCPPKEVTGLRLEGHAPTSIRFDSQDDLTGPSTNYRVVGGLISDLRASGGFQLAVCQGTFPDTPAQDTRTNPSPGDGFYYLVGGRTICPIPGPGTFGNSGLLQDPRALLDAADPCAGSGFAQARSTTSATKGPLVKDSHSIR